MEDIKFNLAMTFEGWLQNDEAIALYLFAKQAPGTILEIGSFKGKSTGVLLAGSNSGNKAKVITIDTFIGNKEHELLLQGKTTLDEFKTNMDKLGLKKQLKVIQGKSVEEGLKYSTKDIDLLFIDGSHEWFDVASDFFTWYPHVKNNGIIIFHDYHNIEAVANTCDYLKKYFFNWKVINSCFIIWKESEKTIVLPQAR